MPLSYIRRTACCRLCANGMPEATLRRHLAALVAAGILLRRDSPNGKRYVREGGEGRETYGFDLSLLIARGWRIEALRDGRRSRRSRTPAASRSRYDPPPRIARDRDRGGCRQAFRGIGRYRRRSQGPVRRARRSARQRTVSTPSSPLCGHWRLPWTLSLQHRNEHTPKYKRQWRSERAAPI